MARKYQYVVTVENSPFLSGVFEAKDAAVQCFKEAIFTAFEDVKETLEEVGNDNFSEEDLKGDYYQSEEFKECVENYQYYGASECFCEDEAGWVYSYPYVTEFGAEERAFGCDFSLFIEQFQNHTLERRWHVSLACYPVFDSVEDQKAYYETAREDEFLRSQFVGKDGKGWNPFQ